MPEKAADWKQLMLVLEMAEEVIEARDRRDDDESSYGDEELYDALADLESAIKSARSDGEEV